MPELVDPSDAEQFKNAFAELQAAYETFDDDETETPGEEIPDETPKTEEEETKPGDGDDDDEDFVEVGGQKLTLKDIEELQRLKSFLDDGTKSTLQSTHQQMEQARQSTPAIPATLQWTPPEPPADLDLDDPGIKALWDNQVRLESQVQAQLQESLRRMQTETVADVERAVDDWNKKYKLDDKTILSVRQNAAASGVATTLAASGKSIYEGVVASLESAFWADPNLRTQYLAAAEAANKQTANANRNKKNKLSALGGKGSSAAKTKPVTQMTPDERRQGMIAELTEELNRT